MQSFFMQTKNTDLTARTHFAQTLSRSLVQFFFCLYFFVFVFVFFCSTSSFRLCNLKTTYEGHNEFYVITCPAEKIQVNLLSKATYM